MMRWGHAMLLLMLLCAVVGIAGYRHGLGVTVGDGFEEKRSSTPPGGKLVSANERSNAAGDRSERLKALLAKPEASRQASSEAWSIIRGLTLDEVKEALAEVRGQGKAGQADLKMMLYFRWGQIDPEAAVRTAAEARDDGMQYATMSSALTAWMKQDPEAAYRYAIDNKDLSEAAVFMMSRMLAGGDMGTALEKADRLGGDLRKKVLDEFASAAGLEEESRRAFLDELALHGTEQERVDGAVALVKRWSEVDPGAAMGATGELEAARNQAAPEIFRRWLLLDPSAAIVWSVEHPGVLDDAARVKQYERLTLREPTKAAEALALLETQPGFMEAAVKELQASYDREGWSPYGSDLRALGLTTAALRTHFQRWRALDPAAAAAWRDTLPARLQDNLTAVSDEGP